MKLTAPRVTGALLIGAAVLANAAFLGLGSAFGYPDVLQLPAPEALARLVDESPLVPALFVVLAAAAALLVPVALGLARLGAGRWPRVTVAAGTGAALVQVVGLLRWPLLVPGLAATATDPSASEAARQAAGERFERLGTVLGRIVGESGGYHLTAVFTVVVVLALRERYRLSRLQLVLGLGSVPLVLAGLLVPLGVPGADAANFAGYVVWTAWCIVLGVRLVRTRQPGRTRGTRPPVPALSELRG